MSSTLTRAKNQSGPTYWRAKEDLRIQRQRRENQARQDKVARKISFRQFIEKVNPRFQFYRHCNLLIDILQRVADGEIKRLLVFTPPRHGKSETVSRLFSAYFLYRYPDRWVGMSSYAADLAYTLSRASRENYLRAVGTLSDQAAAVKQWETGQGGGLWASGAGGPATGKGGHCFPAGTMVETEQGPISIDTLSRLQDRPKVLSFNHEKQVVEFRPILAAAIQPGKPLVEITLHSGRRIRCTADHPIYCVERGYRQAATLVSGETVIQVSTVQELPDLRNGDWKKCDLQQVPHQDKRDSLPPSLRALWRRIYAPAMRIGEGACAWLRGFLLRRELQSGSPRSQESSEMQCLWRSCSQVEAKVLRGLPSVAFGALAAIAGYYLRLLWNDLSSAQLPDDLLQQRLQPVRSFASDAWQGQQSLQNWNELCRLVQEDAPGYPRKRWTRLRSLWSEECSTSDAAIDEGRQASCKIAASHSPYRPSSAQQQVRESCNAVRKVPRHTSQIDRCWQTDTVSSVAFLREIPERVYDLQVEGNSNFFADGVLAHNCLIVDDPIKNSEEAASETIREKLREWWNSTWYTREEPWSETDPNGAMIIVQTRWHEDDLSGWLLQQERDAEDEEDREHWHIVNLPAIAEEVLPDQFPASCTVEPDFRQLGEALCPERRPLEKLYRIMKRIGGYFWEALFQQRPSAKEGETFKVGKLETVDTAPAGLRMCRGWDLAATEDGGDHTAGVLIGRDTKTGLWYVVDVVRGRWSSDDVETQLLSTARQDGRDVRIHLPQDPAQAGKRQAQQLTRLLAGFRVKAEPVGGAKETRAFGFSAQVNAGNVKLVMGPWIKDFKEELRQFPRGTYDDQVDAASDAFNELTEAKRLVGV